MTNADTAREPDSLVGLAFPVIRVRYAGPTDHRGSRYIATLRGVRHTEHYDPGLDGSRNAYNAAAACWAKYRAKHVEAYAGDDQPRVFVPGDLDADSYSYTVVPVGFLAAPQREWAGGYEPVKVTRTDYPGAPAPGDRFGWVVVGPNGGRMSQPYRDKDHAEHVLSTYAPDATLVHVDLAWREVQS